MLRILDRHSSRPKPRLLSSGCWMTEADVARRLNCSQSEVRQLIGRHRRQLNYIHALPHRRSRFGFRSQFMLARAHLVFLIAYIDTDRANSLLEDLAECAWTGSANQ